MGRIRVESFMMSLDGYGAGPDQDLANPMGVGGGALSRWAFTTRTFRTMFGQDGGAEGVDDDYAQRGFRNVGAWILGRNMFGPVRGPWPDYDWRGWWGENPPYHVPIFVLTHYARPPLKMEGDNVFHFVTGGLAEAVAQARAAAGDKDVRIGGGVQTVREGLTTGVIDEMHMAISPVLLGAGEHLMTGLNLPALGYKVAQTAQGEEANHVVIARGP
ncbi:MAG: dihydrofolate reductase family protein [bacterium]